MSKEPHLSLRHTLSQLKKTQSCPTPICSFPSPPMTLWAIFDNTTARMHQHVSCHRPLFTAMWIWESNGPKPRVESQAHNTFCSIYTMFCTAPRYIARRILMSCSLLPLMLIRDPRPRQNFPLVLCSLHVA